LRGRVAAARTVTPQLMRTTRPTTPVRDTASASRDATAPRAAAPTGSPIKRAATDTPSVAAFPFCVNANAVPGS